MRHPHPASSSHSDSTNEHGYDHDEDADPQGPPPRSPLLGSPQIARSNTNEHSVSRGGTSVAVHCSASHRNERATPTRADERNGMEDAVCGLFSPLHHHNNRHTPPSRAAAASPPVGAARGVHYAGGDNPHPNHLHAQPMRRAHILGVYLRIEKQLGAGSSGVALLCRSASSVTPTASSPSPPLCSAAAHHHHLTVTYPSHVVVKVLLMPPSSGVGSSRGGHSTPAERHHQRATAEAACLRRLQHPHIVRYLDAWIEEGRGAWCQALCIAMEHCEAGDLGTVIAEARQRRCRISNADVNSYAMQLLHALKYAHRNKVLHRDLKPNNIFMRSAGHAVIGDFGIARSLNYTQEMARTRIGTPYYVAPEVVRGVPYNAKADVWSFGVILYEVMMLRRPFDVRSSSGRSPCNGGGGLQELYDAITHHDPLPALIDHCSSLYDRHLIAMVRSCLSKQPITRLTATQLLAEYGPHVPNQSVVSAPPPLLHPPTSLRQASSSPPPQSSRHPPHPAPAGGVRLISSPSAAPRVSSPVLRRPSGPAQQHLQHPPFVPYFAVCDVPPHPVTRHGHHSSVRCSNHEPATPPQVNVQAAPQDVLMSFASSPSRAQKSHNTRTTAHEASNNTPHRHGSPSPLSEVAAANSPSALVTRHSSRNADVMLHRPSSPMHDGVGRRRDAITDPTPTRVTAGSSGSNHSIVHRQQSPQHTAEHGGTEVTHNSGSSLVTAQSGGETCGEGEESHVMLDQRSQIVGRRSNAVVQPSLSPFRMSSISREYPPVRLSAIVESSTRAPSSRGAPGAAGMVELMPQPNDNLSENSATNSPTDAATVGAKEGTTASSPTVVRGQWVSASRHCAARIACGQHRHHSKGLLIRRRNAIDE